MKWLLDMNPKHKAPNCLQQLTVLGRLRLMALEGGRDGIGSGFPKLVSLYIASRLMMPRLASNPDPIVYVDPVDQQIARLPDGFVLGTMSDVDFTVWVRT